MCLERLRRDASIAFAFRRTRLSVLALSAVVSLLGCDGPPELPTGPSTLEEGIVIYQDVNFLGASAHVTQDVDDLSDFDGPCEKTDDTGTIDSWDDCISSVRVAPGWRAILYRAQNFDEESLDLTEDLPSLAIPGPCRDDSFNDCVSSIRVFPP